MNIDPDILNETMPGPEERAERELARIATRPRIAIIDDDVAQHYDHATYQSMVKRLIDSGCEIVIMKPGAQGISTCTSPTRRMTSTMPSYQELPKSTRRIEEIMALIDMQRLEDQVAYNSFFGAYRAPRSYAYETYDDRGHPQPTWEWHAWNLLEQRQREVLRARREARARQTYQPRAIVVRTQKRTRSPKHGGFLS